MTNITAIRGMNDILPAEIHLWQHVEEILRKLTWQYGYQELRSPMLEKTALFSRSIGEVTDIVEKEMYTFLDRNQESLSLRPEGTAGCVRAFLQHQLNQSLPKRLWYMGPMYRYERPQQGRYRQFYQFGLEAFGLPDPDIEAEMLAFVQQLWRALGIQEALTLKINYLGSTESRQQYRQALIHYFEQHHANLDEDSQRRLHTNPLRILDSKNPVMQALITAAPHLSDYLDAASHAHFEQLQNFLSALDIPFAVEPRLVRGLDYYTGTVFEWQTDKLGSQNAVGGGGRYDALVKKLGGSETPAVGFSLGIERILALINLANPQSIQTDADIYLIGLGVEARARLLLLAESLRDHLPKFKIVYHGGDASMKSQMKAADRSGARFALILGENELREQQILLKDLRGGDGAQELININEIHIQLVARMQR